MAESLKPAMLILAAGGSQRLGTPKQRVRLGKATLLQRSVRLCSSLPAHSVHVVLGAHAEACLRDLAAVAANCYINPEWEKGMGHSLAVGVERIAENPDVPAVLVLHVDQYRVRSKDLINLISSWQQTPDRIVAAAFDETVGPPAIFPRRFFPVLQSRSDEKGAKQLLLRAETGHIGMPAAAHDLDTPDDLESLDRFAAQMA